MRRLALERATAAAVAADCRVRWRSLAMVGLAFRLGSGLLMAPLYALLLRLAMLGSGRSVLADTDLLYFATSPLGLAGALLIGVAVVTLVALEGASLMAVLAAPPGQQSAVEALATAARQTKPVCLAAARLVTHVLMWLAPAIAIGAVTYATLLSRFDINYYLTERPPEFWTAGAVLIGLGAYTLCVAVRLATDWSLVLPTVLFESLPAADAYRTALRRARDRRWTIRGMLVAWAVASALLSFVATGLVTACAWLAAPFWPRSLTAVATGVGLWLVATVVVGVVTNLMSTAALVSLLRRLYLRFGGRRSRAAQQEPTDATTRFRVTRTRVVVAAFALLLAAATIGLLAISNLPVNDDLVVIGHRGAPTAAPENSLASIRAAIDAGADWIEIDVQETADGEVVVFHDSDFMKSAGVDLKIWDATAADLEKIDIGRPFDPAFAGERVPTLAHVLDACRDKAVVLVELKYYGHNVRLEQRVVDLVETHGMVDQTRFMSLKQEGVAKLKSLRPDWTAGQLLSVAVGDRGQLTADFLAVNASFATRSLIRSAHDRGRDVYAWTVNDPVQVSALASRGVDGVITDDPAMAKAVLTERATLTPGARLLVELADRFGFVLGRRATPFAEQ